MTWFSFSLMFVLTCMILYKLSHSVRSYKCARSYQRCTFTYHFIIPLKKWMLTTQVHSWNPQRYQRLAKINDTFLDCFLLYCTSPGTNFQQSKQMILLACVPERVYCQRGCVQLLVEVWCFFYVTWLLTDLSGRHPEPRSSWVVRWSRSFVLRASSCQTAWSSQWPSVRLLAGIRWLKARRRAGEVLNGSGGSGHCEDVSC